MTLLSIINAAVGFFHGNNEWLPYRVPSSYNCTNEILCNTILRQFACSLDRNLTFLFLIYDKGLETKLVTGVQLNYPLFRWEVVYNRVRAVEKYLGLNQLTIRDLLSPDNWQSMAIDAISKYENSMRVQ